MEARFWVICAPSSFFLLLNLFLSTPFSVSRWLNETSSPYSLRHCDYGNIKFIERTRKWSFEPSSHAFANNLITADSNSLSHLERCPSYPKSVVLWSFGYKSALLIYGSINSSAAKPNSSTMILNRFRCITEIGPLNELPRFSIHPGYPGINRNLNQRSSRIINKTDIYAIDASPPPPLFR